MIGYLVDAVREHVVLPQTLDTVELERRIFDDPDRAPVNVYDRYAQVMPLTTTPLGFDIGGMSLRVRHEIAIVLTVSACPDLEAAEIERGPIALDLLVRALRYEWANVADPDGMQEIDTHTASVDWSSLGLSDTDANATITLTLDCTLTL